MQPTDIKSILDAQTFLGRLYPNQDMDFSYLFGYAARHLGYLSKSLTKGAHPHDEFVRSLSWILGLANKLEIDLQAAMILRHPDVCPYCVVAPCACIFTGKQPAQGIKAYKVPEELAHKAELVRSFEDKTFDAHAERLVKIYPGNWQVWSVVGAWQCTSKINEELAEVHEAATRYLSGRKRKEAVGEELADLVAWFISAWSISTNQKSLDDSFIRFYARGCPGCEKFEECECRKYSDNSGELVEPSKLEEIEMLFLQLANEVGATGETVADVRASLEEAKKTQSEPVARGAAQQTFKVAEELLQRTAKASSSAVQIWENLSKALNSLSFFNSGSG